MGRHAPDGIRVLLADDHAMLRAGLKALPEAEDDIEVVGEAGTGEEALERTDALKPVLEAGGSNFVRKTVREEQKDLLDPLTEREREVLSMTAEGFSSREIGEKPYISPKTVDTYRARVMEKLQLNHRSQLVRFALETGLLTAN